MAAENTSVILLNYIWLIPLFPFLSALFLTVLKDVLQPRESGWIALLSVVCSFLVGKFLLITLIKRLLESNPTVFHTKLQWSWISIGDLHIDFLLQFDILSGSMCVLVTGVGLLIFLYSIGYMEDDRSGSRYFALLSLFVGFMLWLVLSANPVMMFIGWEGVALCSWALIGFWFQDHKNAKAGNKAFLLNRIGDAAFLLGIFLLFWSQVRSGIQNPTLNFLELTSDSSALVAIKQSGTIFGLPVPLVAGLLFLLGATGKSAQIPLYLWLPDAMAGPTPVSALIHAATMVTAGVFLLIRLHPLYELTHGGMITIGYIGGLTLLLGALFACFENKMKRILAYSTISQIGYMILAVGVGAYGASMFHLITHGFFKALLFLGAGMVLHATGGIKDIRKLGGLRHKMPITFWTFLIGSLALIGFPPFSGFWSKDEILWAAYQENIILFSLGLIGVLLTAFYVSRLLFVSFFGSFRSNQSISSDEDHLTMTVPLTLLAFFSVAAGVIGFPKMIAHPLGLENWIHSLFPQGAAPFFHHATHATSGNKLLLMGGSTLLALVGVMSAWWIYMIQKSRPVSDRKASSFTYIFQQKLLINSFLHKIIVQPVRYGAKILEEALEKFIIDKGLVEGSALLLRQGSIWYRKFQNGRINRYLFWMFLGTTLIIILLQNFIH